MNKSQKAVAAATRRQEAAWVRWQASDSAADMAAWSKAVDEQRAVEERAADAADRAEAVSDRRGAMAANDADRQADWWDAAMSNARCAA